MPAERFAAFAEESQQAYADDNVLAGRWPEAGALQQARAEFARLLPQGVATPGHRLYEILEKASGQCVGVLWLALQQAGAERVGYVYNLRVGSAFRGRGHARAAMQLAEAEVLAAGGVRMALHVFGFNTSAQALYRSLGYGITGLNMAKPLRIPGA